MTTGERIKRRRQELGMSADQLAELLGKNRATVYRYESNEIENLPTSILVPLAKALKTTPAYLMGWVDTNPSVDMPSGSYPVVKRRYPVLGSVACGEPILMSEEVELFTTSVSEVNADFVLIAKGDSMIGARIHDGDAVFIRKQPTVENGEIAAVAIDDEVQLKRVYYDPEARMITVMSENPKFAPKTYAAEYLDRIKILGKAVAFQSILD